MTGIFDDLETTGVCYCPEPQIGWIINGEGEQYECCLKCNGINPKIPEKKKKVKAK